MAQVKKLLDSARERASNILSSHEADLHLLATTLLDKETLSGTQARLLHSASSLTVQASRLGARSVFWCSCKQACACPQKQCETASCAMHECSSSIYT